jgi:hypothetical protein
MSGASPSPDPERELPADVHDYLVECVLAQPPSLARSRALLLLGQRPRTAPPPAVDWDALEHEATRLGCTVADVIARRAGRRFPDASF